ncbi:MAG: response regulator transcription factor [Chloroflexi bacterium]|nr:response regulator transcription factor [Chloroflexota bacterium]
MTLDSNNNILVASDDAALVKAISGSLHANGFRVCTANQHANHPPRLIVLDTEASSETRARVLNAFGCDPDGTTPPIVALSPRAALKETAAQKGVWVCLAKPIELDSLLSAVERISDYTSA